MLSRKAKYAIIAMIYLGRHHGRGAKLISEVAEDEHLPKKFLELILLELKNAGFLDSKKGKGGGYQLAKDPATILVGDIIRTIDGPIAPVRCASNMSPVPCEECANPDACAIRDVMHDVRDAMSSVLDAITLEQLIARQDVLLAGRSAEEMYYI